jgi:hypothetical protein
MSRFCSWKVNQLTPFIGGLLVGGISSNLYAKKASMKYAKTKIN